MFSSLARQYRRRKLWTIEEEGKNDLFTRMTHWADNNGNYEERLSAISIKNTIIPNGYWHHEHPVHTLSGLLVFTLFAPLSIYGTAYLIKIGPYLSVNTSLPRNASSPEVTLSPAATLTIMGSYLLLCVLCFSHSMTCALSGKKRLQQHKGIVPSHVKVTVKTMGGNNQQVLLPSPCTPHELKKLIIKQDAHQQFEGFTKHPNAEAVLGTSSFENPKFSRLSDKNSFLVFNVNDHVVLTTREDTGERDPLLGGPLGIH